MEMLSVFLVYQGPAGVPVTVARLDETDIVRHVAELAVQAAVNRATSITQADPQWGEVEKVEALRLRLILNTLLPPEPAPTPAAPQYDDDAVPPTVM
jgi:hypothetical protein